MTDRSQHRLLALPALLLAASATAPAATAAPAAVNLRVEGAITTLFEDRITTDGRTVTTASGGSHQCDGTNGGVNPTPGPSATAALDEGARMGGFTWDGTYDNGFDDYLISRIGPDSQTSSQFWALLVNSEFSSVGLPATRPHRRRGPVGLRRLLEGPRPAARRAVVGHDRAAVHRQGDRRRERRAARGRQRRRRHHRRRRSRRRDDRGQGHLPAEGVARRLGALNAPPVCVDPPGAMPCTSFDSAAPRVRLGLPGEYASDGSRSALRIEWLGEDGAGGSGVTSYDVAYRKLTTPTSRALDAAPRRHDPYARELPRRAGPRRVPRGRRGPGTEPQRARERQRDRPDRRRDRKRLRTSRGWRRLKRKGAWGGRVLRSRRTGARARLRFHGRAVALIGRRLPRGGRLRVTIDGRSKVIRLRGRSRFRQVLFTSAA